MTHTYTISGMTCGSCVSKVKSELLKLGNVLEASVQLAAPQATITFQQHVPLPQLQEAIGKAGPYRIKEEGAAPAAPDAPQASWLVTYKPVLLIGAYLTAATLLLEWREGAFDTNRWMHHFMGGFFLVFSFFKLLGLQAFAQSYASYDVIAKRWTPWGLIYPFIELGLGLAFLLHLAPLLTNGLTFVVMLVSSIGVVQSLLARRKIQCACLGAVFNLPMSRITFIEDALMIVMSGWMVINLM
jgi:copper chaperone CopZ